MRTSLDAFNISARTASAPAIIRGSVDLSTYPGVVMGALPGSTERNANGTALQAALDYCGSNNKYAELPPGRYEFAARTVDSASNAGLQVKRTVPGLIGGGVGSDRATALVQFATNHPVLTIGDIGPSTNSSAMGVYRGFALGHGVSQNGKISADGLLIGNVWLSTFDDIMVTKSLGGHMPHVGIRVGNSSSNFFFSNKVGTVFCDSALQNLLLINAGGTGSVWDNVYLGGGSLGNRTVLGGPACWVASSGVNGGTFGQLNIEWISSRSPFLRCEGVAMNISNLHIEGCQLNGVSPTIVYAVEGEFDIGRLELVNNWIAAVNASGTPTLLSGYDVGKFRIGYLTAIWDGASASAEAVASMAFRLYGAGSTYGFQPQCEIGAALFQGHTGSLSLDVNTGGAAPGSAGAITRFLGYEYNPSLSKTKGAVIEMADADMTVYGRHYRCLVNADMALTRNRTLTLSDKWSASGAGSTSARVAGDILTVNRAAGGAFNLVVQDQYASSLYAFSGSGSAGTSKSFEWSGSAWFAL